MATIWHCGVLLVAACLSIGPLAQDSIPKALVTNKHEAAVAKHRLTVDNVRKLFAVDRELLRLMKEVPDLPARMGELESRIDPERREHSVALEAQVFDGIPETAQILRKLNMTAREYVLTKIVSLAAEMSDEALKTEAFQNQENSDAAEFIRRSQSLQFWRTMDPALKAEAEAWKKVRQEIATYGRERGGR